MELKILLLSLFLIETVFSRSFTIDYQNNCFLKDGKPFRYVSGSIHYFRVPNQFWHDRIYKMKMAGLNTIQTYIEWNTHEPEPGVYKFDGDQDLERFLKTAQDLDMLVILRAGPFIDAEREHGGFPYWLIRDDPNMKTRTMDLKYMKYVDQWYGELYPRIKPYLYSNGGPVISIQIENEYGGVGACDIQYLSHLRDLVRKYLNDVIIFTTDQANMKLLSCGKTAEVFSTIDFGPGANVTYMFEMLRWVQASGPLVNSEYYPGWLDHWGTPHANVDIDRVVKTLDEMLAVNASVNSYMFHGGTSFGFSAGSNMYDRFVACPTSYDYDAPLSEAGDPTPKYYAMRDTIGKYLPLPPGPVPQPSPKMETAPITMKRVMSLWDYMSRTNNSITSDSPQSFEKISHPYGFVVYSTTVNFNPPDPAVLNVKGIADRGYVYVNKRFQGLLSREVKTETVALQIAKGERIDILVENQGRICTIGTFMDQKGIYQDVTLGSKKLNNWTMTPVLLDSASIDRINTWKKASRESDPLSTPAIFAGEFTIPKQNGIFDSFLKVEGWHKGVAFLNNFNLGRYWPIVGPQVTLYAPSFLFQAAPTVNNITLLELESSPCGNGETCTLQFVKNHKVNGTTPEF